MKKEEKYDNFSLLSEEEIKCLKGYELLLIGNNIPKHIFSIGYEKESCVSITLDINRKWNVSTTERGNKENLKQFDDLYSATCYMTELITNTKEQEIKINESFEKWQEFIYDLKKYEDKERLKGLKVSEKLRVKTK